MLQRIRISVLAVAMGSLITAATAQADAKPADNTAISPQCTAAEYRQFDFWLGDWDTFEVDPPGKESIARARVESIAQGCAIHELYEQTDGLIGDSILSYDAVRKQWQQTWVTNRGSIMTIYGNFNDGALVLEGESHAKDGKTVNMRITWKTEGEHVRESAVISKNGGKVWEPAFDVLFRKRDAK